MQECENRTACCPVIFQMFPSEFKEVGEYVYLEEWQKICKRVMRKYELSKNTENTWKLLNAKSAQESYLLTTKSHTGMAYLVLPGSGWRNYRYKIWMKIPPCWYITYTGTSALQKKKYAKYFPTCTSFDYEVESLANGWSKVGLVWNCQEHELWNGIFWQVCQICKYLVYVWWHLLLACVHMQPHTDVVTP